MTTITSRLLALSVLVAPLPTIAQQPTTPPAAPPAATPGGAAAPASGQSARRPRPYRQVITDKAVTDTGGITIHKVDDRWMFEVPDSLLNRDVLLVSRIAGVPAGVGGSLAAGSSVEERVVRFERQHERLVLRSISFDAFAEDSLPIAISVASNNVGAILAAFPIQAFGRDSASFVIDVTDFFSGDTPGISGLTATQRRTYQVRRLDPARSFVNSVRSFPMNVEVRHTQTFDAAEPPSDRSSATISLEMRQSIVLLPRIPMRPRYADERAGFFTVSRVNYGLDELKAADQTFIRRWRLEPKDPAAYARGELVEPVKPIVYYLDPATPAKWRPYVRQGIEDWQKVFEAAGFKNAILAKDPPSRREDPEWDPEDIRYSVVRWAASTFRNAVGPSTSDPRTGEIIESDITWFHNHLRSYRNRLMIETGAANPLARSLSIPDELMGETMRKVITHEVGHAIGLPHNMIASSSFPVDSLRSRSFVSQYGVSATIMDYARQNYVAQPGDRLEPKDFIRRLGPFDAFIINWGYRVFPQAATPEAERPILNRLLSSQTGAMPYRYLPQFLSGIDPRSQTEDLGDDAVRSSTYAIANLKRVVPSLTTWTSRNGEGYDDLTEIYGETVGMWSQYMGHVVSTIGGVHVEPKMTEQSGVVFRAVSRARQREALGFLAEQVFRTPSWLVPEGIVSRIGPPVGNAAVLARQSTILTNLLDTRRLARLADGVGATGSDAYSLNEYLHDLRRALWGNPPVLANPDANRRALHRVYVERLGTLVTPPPAPAASTTGGPGGAPDPLPSPLLATPNVQRTDIPALARAQLRIVRDDARRAAVLTPSGTVRAHWLDVADRVQQILDPVRGN
ncbi:MAG TPA: zinc-dependent metalloprotease [Gemmatimonadaceae bacterium]|nr:zinc-dependent metalloprotease [Gemmatimonadaceae bacterium]